MVKRYQNLITVTRNHMKLHKSYRLLVICTFSVCAERQTDIAYGDTDKRTTEWYMII